MPLRFSSRRDALVAFAFRRDLPVRSAFRRDALVASAAQSWIIHSVSAGTTGVPLRILPAQGRDCRVRFSEGPAYQVRCTTLDDPSHFTGRDKHAPPIPILPSQGRDCRLHWVILDPPFRYCGYANPERPSAALLWISGVIGLRAGLAGFVSSSP